VVRSFARWRDPLTVMRLAELVVWQRGAAHAGEIVDWLPRDSDGRTPVHRVLEPRQIEVSSTEVRARVAAGRSIHGFVPDAVRVFIDDVGLYRRGDEREEGNGAAADR
jgi:nicotinate-nucleotide adenylyltransferase